MEMNVSARLLAAAGIIGVLFGFAAALFLERRSRRSCAEELTQHPERLDEMLDPTDDA